MTPSHIWVTVKSTPHMWEAFRIDCRQLDFPSHIQRHHGVMFKMLVQNTSFPPMGQMNWLTHLEIYFCISELKHCVLVLAKINSHKHKRHRWQNNCKCKCTTIIKNIVLQFNFRDSPSCYKVKQMLPALIDFAEFVLDFCSFAFMAGLSQSLPHLFQLMLALRGHWDLFLIVLITKRLHICSVENSCFSHIQWNKFDILIYPESILSNQTYRFFTRRMFYNLIWIIIYQYLSDFIRNKCVVNVC